MAVCIINNLFHKARPTEERVLSWHCRKLIISLFLTFFIHVPLHQEAARWTTLFLHSASVKNFIYPESESIFPPALGLLLINWTAFTSSEKLCQFKNGSILYWGWISHFRYRRISLMPNVKENLRPNWRRFTFLKGPSCYNDYCGIFAAGFP